MAGLKRLYNIRADRLVSVVLHRKENIPATVVIDLWSTQGGTLLELPAALGHQLRRQLAAALKTVDQ